VSGPASGQLRISEIFLSLQGETNNVGLPTVFVRLTGCPLRCHYCDTAYAFSGGTLIATDSILRQVADYGVSHVTVTGGEPLAQPGCLKLLQLLCDAGHAVSLETSGALDVAGVDPRVSKVLDLKTPASGETARNLWGNLAHCGARDQVKFVICDRQDYAWAKLKCDEYDLYAAPVEVLFSPSWGALDGADLAAWILQDRLPVRMQLQLHKILWGDRPGT
jgi:7-carboxy-7-deazaguanine synthase